MYFDYIFDHTLARKLFSDSFKLSPFETPPLPPHHNSWSNPSCNGRCRRWGGLWRDRRELCPIPSNLLENKWTGNLLPSHPCLLSSHHPRLFPFPRQQRADIEEPRERRYRALCISFDVRNLFHSNSGVSFKILSFPCTNWQEQTWHRQSSPKQRCRKKPTFASAVERRNWRRKRLVWG